KLAVAGAFDAFEELLRDDLVGIDVGDIEWGGDGGESVDGDHYFASVNSQLRMSVKWPAMAAAAAIWGLTRWVRPPRPWRPSKLRLLVEAQRSPGCRMSGFIPRHMEQPGSRHSKPAVRTPSSRPSSSACFFTCCEPGTTIARTCGWTWYPLT